MNRGQRSRRRRCVLGNEYRHLLTASVFEHLEVVFAKVRHGFAAFVDGNDIDTHEPRGGSECRLSAGWITALKGSGAGGHRHHSKTKPPIHDNYSTLWGKPPVRSSSDGQMPPATCRSCSRTVS